MCVTGASGNGLSGVLTAISEYPEIISPSGISCGACAVTGAVTLNNKAIITVAPPVMKPLIFFFYKAYVYVPSRAVKLVMGGA